MMKTIFIFLLMTQTTFAYTTLGILKGNNFIRSGIIYKKEILVKYTGKPYRKFFTDLPGYDILQVVQLSDKELIEDSIRKAILAWLEPLREISPLPISESIQFVEQGEDVEIQFSQETGDSYYNPFNRTIVLKKGHHTYSKILHEFGHAFGLGDIGFGVAMGGEKYNSAPGVMRVPNNKTALTKDDINGVRYHFCLDTEVCNPQKYPTYTFDQYLNEKFWQAAETKINLVLSSEISIDIYKFTFDTAIGKNGNVKIEEALKRIFDQDVCQTSPLTDECKKSVQETLINLKSSN